MQWYPPSVTVPLPPPPPPPPTTTTTTTTESQLEPSDKVEAPKSPLTTDEVKQEEKSKIMTLEIEEEVVVVDIGHKAKPEGSSHSKSENSLNISPKSDEEKRLKEAAEKPGELREVSKSNGKIQEKSKDNNIINKGEEKDKIDKGTEEIMIDKEKEKDKELMNKIKEKIRRKKEEKLLKEKEEFDAFQQKQQEKEDQLREKLIQKKLEREKVLKQEKSPSAEKECFSKAETDDSQVFNETKSEENFSLDIFAEEVHNTQTESDEKGSGKKTLSKKQDEKEEKLVSETDAKPMEHVTDNANVALESPVGTPDSREMKGSWRIVDSVYDDDNSDSEGDDSKASLASEKSAAEEMEDYANMLLEGVICIFLKTRELIYRLFHERFIPLQTA